MRSDNMLRGTLFAIDRELENLETLNSSELKKGIVVLKDAHWTDRLVLPIAGAVEGQQLEIINNATWDSKIAKENTNLSSDFVLTGKSGCAYFRFLKNKWWKM